MTKKLLTKPASLIVSGIVVSIAAFAWGQDVVESLTIEQSLDHDIYAARSEVIVQSDVNGDLVAAGREVSIAGDISGDVIAAAQEIEIGAEVGDDVRVAGQHVRITSPVSGHVVAAGQTVTIDHPVGDWAWLTGYSVEVNSDIGGELKIRAKETTIDGEVAGDIDVIGDSLDLGPKAIVRGNLRWRSDNQPVISPDAQIEGELIEEPPPGIVEELTDSDTYSLPFSGIIAVSALFLLFARAMRASADRAADRPGRSILLGVLVFLILPSLTIAILIVGIASGIGIWLGFSALLIYAVILLLGILTGLFSISDSVLRKFREQPAIWQSLAAIFLSVVAFGLLAKIPWVGVVIVFAVWWLGIGALCWNSWTTLRSFRHEQLES